MACIQYQGCKFCLTSCCVRNHRALRDLAYVRVIGSGVSGVVLQLQDPGTKRSFALKVIPLGKLTLSTLTQLCRLFDFDKNAMIPNPFEGKRKDLQISPAQFQEEVMLATRAGQAGVGPEVLDSFTCQNGLYTSMGRVPVGFILMRQLDGNLSQLFARVYGPAAPSSYTNYSSRSYKRPSESAPASYTYQSIKILVKALSDLAKQADRNGLHHRDLHYGNIGYTIRNQVLRVYLLDWSSFDFLKGGVQNNPFITQFFMKAITDHILQDALDDPRLRGISSQQRLAAMRKLISRARGGPSTSRRVKKR